jgi:hypothetical protein
VLLDRCSLSTPVNQYAPYFKEQKLLIIGWSIVFKKLSIFHDDSEFLLRKYPTIIITYYYPTMNSKSGRKNRSKSGRKQNPKIQGQLCAFWNMFFEDTVLKYDYIALLKRIRHAFIFSKSLYSCEPCSMFFRYASSFQNV